MKMYFNFTIYVIDFFHIQLCCRKEGAACSVCRSAYRGVRASLEGSWSAYRGVRVLSEGSWSTYRGVRASPEGG
jgi:hypothetical protein